MSLSGTDRYKFRTEQWGGLIWDQECDRIWGCDADHFSRFSSDPNALTQMVGGTDPFNVPNPPFFGEFPKQPEFSLTAPISVSWVVTKRCQSACIFCCTNSHSKAAWGSEYSAIECALNTLGSWGALRLIIGGGEPLVRHDIQEIVRCADLKGIKPVVATNGFLLDLDTAMRLAPHVAQFQISLDSVRDDEYARLRGKAGGPKFALAAIENAQAAKRNVRVVTVVNAFNYPHLDEIGAAVSASGASQWFIFLVQPSGRGARTSRLLQIARPAQVREKLSELRPALRREMAVCFWGDSTEDGIAVYLDENCNMTINDYRTDLVKPLVSNLSGTTVNQCDALWQQASVKAKYSTLQNFLSARRAIS